MSSTQRVDVWKDSAVVTSYKKSIERVTRPIASLLIMQSGILSSDLAPLLVLDNACGTGAVTCALHEMLDERRQQKLEMICGDKAEGMVDYMKHTIKENGWRGVEAKIVDAQETGLPNDHFTHVMTNFGWQAMPSSLAAVSETHRILLPSGVFGSTAWSHLGWISALRDAHLSLVSSIPSTDPGPPPFPTAAEVMAIMSNGSWDSPSWIQSFLTKEGFENIEVTEKEVGMTWNDVDELIKGPFAAMMIGVLNLVWDKEAFEVWKNRLLESLEKSLREQYGAGGWQWRMVALVVTARKV